MQMDAVLCLNVKVNRIGCLFNIFIFLSIYVLISLFYSNSYDLEMLGEPYN